MPARRFYDVVLKNGVGLTFACMGMSSAIDGPADGTNLSGVGETRLVPDLSTKCRIPWYWIIWCGFQCSSAFLDISIYSLWLSFPSVHYLMFIPLFYIPTTGYWILKMEDENPLLVISLWMRYSQTGMHMYHNICNCQIIYQIVNFVLLFVLYMIGYP